MIADRMKPFGMLNPVNAKRALTALMIALLSGFLAGKIASTRYVGHCEMYEGRAGSPELRDTWEGKLYRIRFMNQWVEVRR